MKRRYRHILTMIIILGGICSLTHVSLAEDSTRQQVKHKADLLKVWGLQPRSTARTKGSALLKGVEQVKRIETVPEDQIQDVSQNYEQLTKLRVAEMMIQFAYDSDVIEGQSSFDVLQFCAEVLQEHPEIKVVIAGHTDSDGAVDYNLQLSQRRAASVRTYLNTRYQIDDTRFVIAAYGEEQPLMSNDSDEGKARNRRVEIIRYQ